MLQGSITLVKYAGNNWEFIAVTLQIMDITDPYQNNQRWLGSFVLSFVENVNR